MGKDAMMRVGCLMTILKAYRLIRIKEKVAALAHQGGWQPLSDQGIVQREKSAQEEEISYGQKTISYQYVK